MLSQWNVTTPPIQCLPQMAQARTMSSNSFLRLGVAGLVTLAHSSWTPVVGFHATLMKLSAETSLVECCRVRSLSKLTPFHVSTNVAHHSMSSQIPMLSLNLTQDCPIFALSSNIRHKNVLPGCTTWAAWPSFPISDSSSFILHDFLLCQC